MEKKRLIDCIEILIDNRGKTPKHKEDGTYKILSANNVKSYGLIRLDEVAYANDIMYDTLMTNELVKNDIIITSEAPAGEVLLWDSDEKIVLGQRLYGLKIDKSIVNPIYLAYYLKSHIGQNEIIKNCTGSTVLGISKKTFDNIWVYIPDKRTQEKIGNVLLSIDRQIMRNNEMVQKLQDLATSTYSRWFNQFEFPNEDGLPYKSNGGAFVYNEKLKRNIPIGWKVEKLPIVFDFLEGPGITKDKYSNIGQNFINIKCLENNFINTNSCSKIHSKYLNEYQKYQLNEEDILISTSGTLGTIGIVTKTNLPLLLNTSIIRFRPLINNGFGYMYSFLTSKYFRDLLYQSATGSIQKNVGPTHLEKFNILVPTQLILKKYNKIIYPIFKQLCLINEQNIELNNLKSKLLPLLINGQLEL